MEKVCLLVDLDDAGLQEDWHEKIYSFDLSLEVSYSNGEDVFPMLSTGDVVGMVVFCQEPSQNLFAILELFKKNVGAFPEFQVIVCDEPSPILMTQVYEWGIETFWNYETWAEKAAHLTTQIVSTLNDEESSEGKIFDLNQSILTGNQERIIESEAAIEEHAEYDYLAAYSRGKALQATGRYNEAVEAFESAKGMNKKFRPSVSGIGENLLVLGRTDEAIEIFKDLEKVNKRNVDRKANLASAYIAKGDLSTAKAYLKEAHKLNPKHPRIAETKAQYLLSTGKIGEAFKVMDNLQDVGPFFAAKLNEMGIKLSQKGKGKSALALYKKAHKIVRPELKYKISMNAALACYRLGMLDMSMKYLIRTEKEFGKSLPKVDKIKGAVKKAQKKQKTKAAG